MHRSVCLPRGRRYDERMRAHSLFVPGILLFAALLPLSGACSTASGGGDPALDPDTGSGTDGGFTPDIGDEARPGDDGGFGPTGPFADFPKAPILDAPTGGTPAPKDAPTLFGAAGSGSATGGPCMSEPEMGSLFPRNWLRPRFKFAGAAGQNLFEIRLHAKDEIDDLVVYTTATTWTMPAAMWTALSTHLLDEPITVTIRGATYDGTKLTAGPSIGTTGTITIAPAAADGSIVYWILPSGAGETSALKGFSVGDESVQDVLKPPQVGAQCIGCHTSSPDGTYVSFSPSDNAGDGSGSAWVDVRSIKDPTQRPPFMTASATGLLARKDQHAGTFSKAHWAAGDRMIVTVLPVAGKAELVWTDLEATNPAQDVGWGIVGRGGDPGGAGSPSFSHDGTKLVYFSAPDVGAGTITGGAGEMYIVPWGAKKGGTATKLAADPASNQYYPQFSADDALVAFNRVPRGQTSYNDAAAEVFVVPASGGTPTRLAANDPQACGGQKSPGVTNSWAKWSPRATPSGSKTYYWLTFASTRGVGNPQLYVTGIVTEGGKITTYPALYLWNQPEKEHNHTPAWDVFALPPVH